LGSKKQDWNQQAAVMDGEKTYWFDTGAHHLDGGETLVDGEVSRASLEWLIDLAETEREQDALQRAAKSIRSFHETHIGVGRLGKIGPISGRPGSAGADVEGLGIEHHHRLEIVHDNRHGIEGFEGMLTYAVLWTGDGAEKTWEIISTLADLRGKLLS
jgi:hypothetical protein